MIIIEKGSNYKLGVSILLFCIFTYLLFLFSYYSNLKYESIKIENTTKPESITDLETSDDISIENYEALRGRVIELQKKMYPSKKKESFVIGRPLKNIVVNDNFGERIHPIYHDRRFHKGVDLKTFYGEKVYSTINGRVVSAEYKGNYGKTVIIKSNTGEVHYFCHLSKICVKENMTPAIGDVIGLAGATGKVTGVHLHYEIRKNGVPIDPMRFIK